MPVGTPPPRTSAAAHEELNQAAVTAAAEQIARNVRRVYLSRTGPTGLPLPIRDVHPKAHGLIQAKFRVLQEEAFDEIERQSGLDLRRGVFRRVGEEFAAQLRFSSSKKRPQSDQVPDGRGLAIKLSDVAGQRLQLPSLPTTFPHRLIGPVVGTSVGQQDFVLLNGPAFFARNATEMVEVSELEARDAFPGAFFLGRAAGLLALLRMARNQAHSPLDLTYFSQTPYALGEHVIKYRVRRSDGGVYPKKHRGADALRHALTQELRAIAPNASIVLEFAVQVAYATDDFTIDDATQVWPEDQSPFLPVAHLVIESQDIGASQNIEEANALAFNPWNGIVEHEPLGSINVVRGVVYEVSRSLRTELARVPRDAAEIRLPGLVARKEHAGTRWWASLRRGCSRLLARLRAATNTLLRTAGRLPMRILLQPWAALIPLALLTLLTTRAWFFPTQPFQLNLTGWMPSEGAIPEAIFQPAFATKGAQQKLETNPRYVFRYKATGSEYDGGIPYWVYRVLPRIAPERFDHARDYRAVGLGPPDDQEFFVDYHGLPRGLVLSDQMIHVLGSDVQVRIKVVSFNCASCHRGEYRDEDGLRKFADGMPNNVLDTAGYKERVYGTLTDARFTADRVISEVDALLAELHARRPKDGQGRELPYELTRAERLTYRLLVGEIKRRASAKSIAWMESRPDNGLGRVDAFGALRFEFLGFDPEEDPHISTVDLPSIWNEGPLVRPRQHWDGNTADVRGRNFGAIIGVGGTPLSVHQRSVGRIAEWLGTLRPPAFPFEHADSTVLAQGKELYGTHCAGCHGQYTKGKERGRPDQEFTRLMATTKCMSEGITDVGTDSARKDAMSTDFIERLNVFGERAGVWSREAFSVPTGYLCPPLDGIWARAPYLHNGSVPTLRDLLTPSAERPETFHRGNTMYDRAAGGFSTELPAGDDSARAFLFQTNEKGNGAIGHEYGPGMGDDDRPVEQIEAERTALIAYLLTL